MKTINLAGLILALLISTAGFAGINFLFTQVAGTSERAPATLSLRV